MTAGCLRAAFRLLLRVSPPAGTPGAICTLGWALACVGFSVAIATLKANAAVILPDLPAGSQYQIVFTSLGGRDASSGNISSYDNFVRQQAATSSSLPDTTWWAVASAGQNAQTTAKVYDGIPVYNTAGQLVASSGSAFYSAVHQSAMNYDQNGDVALYAQVWTGMRYDGAPLDYLDAILPTTTYGFSGATNGTWAGGGTSSNRLERRALYGLSEPITAVPEPSTCAMALAGLACGGWHVFRTRRSRTGCSVGRLLVALLLVTCSLMAGLAHAAPIIDWVTVGDPGNAADTTGYGAVADSFRIMKFEFTNQQYTDFLNSVDPSGTNPNSVYNGSMGVPRGGITNTGTTSGSRYAVKTNMGDKPVNCVSWFDAARVSNWLMNGGTSLSSTETGAYTLNNATSGNAPAVNSGATFYIPTEDQWYKAAYYKGGGTTAGYWDYATQSDSAPTAVTSGSTGIGSSGSTGNFANYNFGADWNYEDGNVTTVGTNGGPSAYGAFDMSGNLLEWNDLTGASGSFRGLRGGNWYGLASYLSSSDRVRDAPSYEHGGLGFRLASPVAVPEPSTWVVGLAGIACGGWQVVRRRRAR